MQKDRGLVLIFHISEKFMFKEWSVVINKSENVYEDSNPL